MKKNKIRVLVLGADGFIGSNLIRALLKESKYQIRAFDLFKDGQSRNLEDIRNRLEIIPGNFLNRDDLHKAVKGIDYVFHYISLTTPGSSINDPLIDVETNIKGSIVLFDECVKSKVKKVIFSSSGGAIYGNQNKNKLSENDATNPISPYAISKLAIEKYLEYYRITRGLDYLILRYANPYGPGQNVVGSQGIIPIFLNLIRQGKPITIYGDGKNTRDYIYIDDAIHITKLVFAKKTKYRLYNVGGGKSASINEVVEIMKNVTKNKIKIVRRPSRNLDVRRILLDTKNIKAETGYVPSVSLVSGIRKTWKWLNKE